MPHLTLPITPAGPLLEFICSVSKPRAEALIKAGLPVPNPVTVRGLIDTGASITGIDPAILKSLGAVSTGTVPLHTPSTKSAAPHIANQFALVFDVVTCFRILIGSKRSSSK